MHLEAITSGQKEVLSKLPQLPGFYLAGDTALALQIGHRISIDFDFFTNKPLPPRILQKLESIFGEENIEVIVREPHALTLKLPGTELTLFSTPFQPLSKLVRWEGRPLLSVPEIGADKSYVLGRRAAWKDYVDLYYILSENHSTLQAAIASAQKKYGDGFDPRLLLEQLLYLDDVPEANIRFLKKAVGLEELAAFFQREIQKMS